jgi:hypothetical protein
MGGARRYRFGQDRQQRAAQCGHPRVADLARELSLHAAQHAEALKQALAAELGEDYATGARIVWAGHAREHPQLLEVIDQLRGGLLGHR